MRSRLLFLALPALAGCGGGSNDGGGVACPAIVSYTPNVAYTGHFAGYFSESGGAAVRLTFDLTVAADGTVTGAVRDVQGVTSAVTGKAADFRDTCDDSQVAVVLDFTPSGGTTQELNVYRKRNGSLPGSFQGNQTSNGDFVGSGTLVVAKAPDPV